MRAPVAVSVLAFQPSTRGLGYIVFEREDRLIDWGVCEARVAKNPRSRLSARRLMAQFKPDVVVMEDPKTYGSRRTTRIVALIDGIAADAKKQGFAVRQIARSAMIKRFSVFGRASNDDVASAVAGMFPELKPRLPKRRQPWQPEHYSMAIFLTAAFAVTFFADQQASLFDQ